MLVDSRKQLVVIVLMYSFASSAFSARITYQWNSIHGDTATGSMTLNDNIRVGDVFDLESNIELFEFSVQGVHFNINDMFYGNSVTAEAGSLGLCAPTCDNHGLGNIASKKTVAKKVVKTTITKNVDNEVRFYPRTERVTKKRVVGASTANTDSFPLWSFDTISSKMIYSVTNPSKKVVQKKIANSNSIITSSSKGSGRWQLIPVPEPVSLLLVLTGFGAFGAMRRMFTKQES